VGLAHRRVYCLRDPDGRPHRVSFRLVTSHSCGLRVRRSWSVTFAFSEGKGLKALPNQRSTVDAGFAFGLHLGCRGSGATDSGRSPTMRAERAKLKSCKDDEIIAQGKRATSAALGYGPEMIFSFFPSGLARLERAKPEGDKEVGCGGLYPGRRPQRPCPGLLSGGGKGVTSKCSTLLHGRIGKGSTHNTERGQPITWCGVAHIARVGCPSAAESSPCLSAA
jgi:hypothetical protein